MASHWLYCCRVGTQDPRGSLAATRVLGDKRCHGTTKYSKKRHWHHTTEAALDAFCVEQVQQAVKAAGEGAQLADGVTEEMAAQRLKQRIAPLHVVDTWRICAVCWEGCVVPVLPEALRELTAALIVTASLAPSPAAGGAAASTPGLLGKRKHEDVRNGGGDTAAVPRLHSPAGAPAVRPRGASPVQPRASSPVLPRAASPVSSPAQANETLEGLRRRNTQLWKEKERYRKEKNDQAQLYGEWKAKFKVQQERHEKAEQKWMKIAADVDDAKELRRQLKRAEMQRDVLQRQVNNLSQSQSQSQDGSEDSSQDSSQGSSQGSADDGETVGLDGIYLDLVVSDEATGRPRLAARYRDVLVELSELYHVAHEKCLQCLLMVLRSTGMEVDCSLKMDSDAQVVRSYAETGEILKAELTNDLIVALAPDWTVPDIEEAPPIQDEATPMLARPRADGGPAEDSGWSSYSQEVMAKVNDCTTAKNQNFGELTDLPDQVPKLESFDDFKQRHPGYGDEELRKLFQGLGCSGFAFYVDDTKKWNMRNQSAMLISGRGITEDGQPRIFALTELFGQGGSTGDLAEILDKMIEQRLRMMAAGQTDIGKLLYLYDIVSFGADNCNSMRGHNKGLHAKIEQVRAFV